MVYCSKCGKENEGNASYCQNCGTRIKPKENKSGISKLINWKAIIIGIVTYFVVALVLELFVYIYGINYTFNIGYTPLPYIFIMSITGIFTGFFSGKEYLNGVINSMIIAVFYSIIYGLLSGFLYYLFLSLILLGVFGLIGGLIGVIIYRKYNNYNLTD